MIFRRATLKLTITYTVVQLALFAIFSIGIYSFVTGTFIFSWTRSSSEAAFDASDRGATLLFNGLIIFYLGLVVVVPLSSWLMARAALKPVRESYERQQQFVDGASHEMRSPLSIIQGELELALARSRSAGEYREAMAIALAATVGLSRLADDLLKLSRTTSNSPDSLASSFTNVDVAAVVEDAVAAVARQAREAGVGVTVDSSGPLSTIGSAELLARAIGNVIENAIKFSAMGDVVVVTANQATDRVVIRVKDSGVGMALGEQKRAFERFWRADAARSTPGHGLGLALVQEIVQAHSGTVELHSEPARGTVVTVTLPVSRQ